LKGHGFQPCRKHRVFIAALEVAENSPLRLFLGGAALQRCGKRFVLIAPLGADGRQFSYCTTTDGQEAHTARKSSM